MLVSNNVILQQFKKRSANSYWLADKHPELVHLVLVWQTALTTTPPESLERSIAWTHVENYLIARLDDGVAE